MTARAMHNRLLFIRRDTNVHFLSMQNSSMRRSKYQERVLARHALATGAKRRTTLGIPQHTAAYVTELSSSTRRRDLCRPQLDIPVIEARGRSLLEKVQTNWTLRASEFPVGEAREVATRNPRRRCDDEIAPCPKYHSMHNVLERV